MLEFHSRDPNHRISISRRHPDLVYDLLLLLPVGMMEQPPSEDQGAMGGAELSPPIQAPPSMAVVQVAHAGCQVGRLRLIRQPSFPVEWGGVDVSNCICSQS